jgi:anti-anti-sigma regulatory factor
MLPLEWAILGGAGLGLVIELAATTQLRLEIRSADLVPLKEGERADTLVVEVSGHLYYAAMRRFLREIERRVPEDTRLVVLDLSHVHGMRYAALLGFEQLRARARKHGGDLVLAGVPPSFAAMLRKVGSDLVAYEYDPIPMQSVKRALGG